MPNGMLCMLWINVRHVCCFLEWSTLNMTWNRRFLGHWTLMKKCHSVHFWPGANSSGQHLIPSWRRQVLCRHPPNIPKMRPKCQWTWQQFNIFAGTSTMPLCQISFQLHCGCRAFGCNERVFLQVKSGNDYSSNMKIVPAITITYFSGRKANCLPEQMTRNQVHGVCHHVQGHLFLCSIWTNWNNWLLWSAWITDSYQPLNVIPLSWSEG